MSDAEPPNGAAAPATSDAPWIPPHDWTEWLDTSVGRVIYYLERYRREYFEKELADYDIGSADVPILIYLWEGHPGATQIEIAKNIGFDPATVTRGLQRLEELEVISRRTSPRDGRALTVSLTEKGRELSPVVLEISKRYHQLMTQDLSEEEFGLVRTALHCMLVRVHDYCEPNDDPVDGPVERYRGSCPDD